MKLCPVDIILFHPFQAPGWGRGEGVKVIHLIFQRRQGRLREMK